MRTVKNGNMTSMWWLELALCGSVINIDVCFYDQSETVWPKDWFDEFTFPTTCPFVTFLCQFFWTLFHPFRNKIFQVCVRFHQSVEAHLKREIVCVFSCLLLFFCFVFLFLKVIILIAGMALTLTSLLYLLHTEHWGKREEYEHWRNALLESQSWSVLFLSFSSVSSRPHKHQNVCLPFDLFTALLRWLCSWQDIKFQLLTKSFCCHCASKAWQGAPGFHWTVTRPFWIVSPTDGWRQYTSGLALWCPSSHTQLGRLWPDRQFSHTAMQDLATHTHTHTQFSHTVRQDVARQTHFSYTFRQDVARHTQFSQLGRMWPDT